MPIATKNSRWSSIGSHFYSVNLTLIYWEYEKIASAYRGFGLNDLKSMAVRQRAYWFSMAKWRDGG